MHTPTNSCSPKYHPLAFRLLLLNHYLFHDLTHYPIKVSATVILKDLHVKLIELLHLIVVQLVQLRPWEHGIHGLWYLWLNSNRNVLFDEVLNSVELVSFFIKFHLRFMYTGPYGGNNFFNNWTVLFEFLNQGHLSLTFFQDTVKFLWPILEFIYVIWVWDRFRSCKSELHISLCGILPEFLNLVDNLSDLWRDLFG